MDKELVRALQRDIPFSDRPFADIGLLVGSSEEQILESIRSLVQNGTIRRFGAAVRHRELGINANAMVVWIVPENRAEEVGTIMASFREVSHCYQRPTAGDWPYNLFTMLHGYTRQECRATAESISRATGIKDYELLFSTRELKKSSMEYFRGNGEDEMT